MAGRGPGVAGYTLQILSASGAGQREEWGGLKGFGWLDLQLEAPVP